MIRLLYFARLRDSLGLGEESIALPDNVGTVSQLRDWLCERPGFWQEELAPGRPIRAAINQVLAQPDAPIRDGDEIAFFPPVTGG